MSTTSQGQPLPLPAAALPDGCPDWDGEQARRWTQAFPPRWVPVRPGERSAAATVVAGLLVAGSLAVGAELHPWVAAVVALHVVWVLVRPEVVRFSAPALIVLVPLLGLPYGVAVPLVLAVVVIWAAALARMAGRRRQRRAARAAAGEVTAVLPDTDGPLKRGWFLAGAGLVLIVLGAVPAGLGGHFDLAEDRQAVPALGWYVAGLGATVLLSGVLGRRRAARLRGVPVPVLRVLVRENADADTEVFAADDVTALRPLFTVAVSEADDDQDDDSDDDDDGCQDDGDDDDEDLIALLERLESDQPGPLREAVLHGLPHDGAEVALVSAAEEPGEPPVTEWSTGPVRLVTPRALRRRLAKAKRTEAYAERGRAAAAAVGAGAEAGAVRRWRAGRLDVLVVSVLVLWGYYGIHGESGAFRYVIGGILGLIGALLLPAMVAWRITADAEGLWFNGLRRTHHIAWDHIRVVRCKGTEFTVDSYRVSFPRWTVHTPRWPWLERRLGLVHPYERTAAEISAMWQDPALRPTGAGGARQLGLPLWPLAVVLGAGWAAVLTLLP
ncbi:hypothetical protein AB0L99_43930 [Streptomyces sp. NPDC051954]|uniref:hypothetical protein n=1 Tax=Streptomyces sp. NPDC051954 TaxID=3155524 RepID=UPI00341FB4AF